MYKHQHAARNGKEIPDVLFIFLCFFCKTNHKHFRDIILIFAPVVLQLVGYIYHHTGYVIAQVQEEELSAAKTKLTNFWNDFNVDRNKYDHYPSEYPKHRLISDSLKFIAKRYFFIAVKFKFFGTFTKWDTSAYRDSSVKRWIIKHGRQSNSQGCQHPCFKKVWELCEVLNMRVTAGQACIL